MNLEQVYQWQAEMERRFPSLGAWQARGLALVCLGVLLQQPCQIRRMAECLGMVGCVNTVRQRLKRWLKNSQIGLQAASGDWIRWVAASFPTQRVVLLVDETKLGDRIGVMLVSWAYEGRAIPLWWRCYYANSAADYPQQGQVLLIYGLLAHVLACLPAQQRPLVQMDRGLAHSSAMLRALKRLRVDFLVRVKQTARFTSRRGHSQLLRQISQRGQYQRLQGTLFARDHQITGYVYLMWEADQPQGWCLFSNCGDLTGGRYAWRWWQEESFKDLKSGGWQWQTSTIACPERMARLLLAMAVAYGWMLSLGTQLGQQPASMQRQIVTRDDFQRLSLFRLGLRWFKACLYQPTLTPPPMRLTFAPPVFRHRF